jgi:DNA-binding response OmpR family regulator
VNDAHLTRRIFIVDDEPDMIKMARMALEQDGYVILSETNPLKAVESIRKETPDLVLLDIRMPGLDGFEVCKRLKADDRTRDIPIIVLSARARETDVVLGIELGAEDYIRKPFRRAELLARVKAVFRRGLMKVEGKHLERGALKMDLRTFEAFLDDRPIKMAPKEFQLLAFFVRREGHVLTRSVISQNVWQTDHLPTSRTIDTHVDLLRKKLGNHRNWIRSVTGIGYRFEMD